MEEAADGDWVVRPLTGASTGKSYRCPGCDQEIRIGTPHVVAWPVLASTFARDATGLDERRHWHTPCWTARERRR